MNNPTLENVTLCYIKKKSLNSNSDRNYKSKQKLFT